MAGLGHLQAKDKQLKRLRRVEGQVREVDTWSVRTGPASTFSRRSPRRQGRCTPLPSACWTNTSRTVPSPPTTGLGLADKYLRNSVTPSLGDDAISPHAGELHDRRHAHGDSTSADSCSTAGA
jgi:hypothetical protein